MLRIMVGRSDAFTVPWYSTHALLVLVESSLELSDGAFCDSVAIVSALSGVPRAG
jgi:hypothetical protein